jgi:hypothetical protein
MAGANAVGSRRTVWVRESSVCPREPGSRAVPSRWQGPGGEPKHHDALTLAHRTPGSVGIVGRPDGLCLDGRFSQVGQRGSLASDSITSSPCRLPLPVRARPPGRDLLARGRLPRDRAVHGDCRRDRAVRDGAVNPLGHCRGRSKPIDRFGRGVSVRVRRACRDHRDARLDLREEFLRRALL